MIVKCPVCKYVFEVEPKDIKFSIGSGVPFVSCRNPEVTVSLGRPFLCDAFIDLSHVVTNDDTNNPSSEES